MENSSNSYLKLKKKWYKKLRDTGFEDIEDEKGRLKAYGNGRVGSSSRAKLAVVAKQEYYRLASQYLYQTTFDTLTEMKVWALHGEGLSLKFISKYLKKSFGFVRYTVEKHRKSMLK